MQIYYFYLKIKSKLQLFIYAFFGVFLQVWNNGRDKHREREIVSNTVVVLCILNYSCSSMLSFVPSYRYVTFCYSLTCLPGSITKKFHVSSGICAYVPYHSAIPLWDPINSVKWYGSTVLPLLLLSLHSYSNNNIYIYLCRASTLS